MTSPTAHESRFVLVTGASTGIGAACALELDRLGFSVLAGVRRAADGQTLCGQASSRLQPILLDVTQADSIDNARGAVAAATGSSGLFGLVNNAGILVPGPLECIELNDLRRQYEVNVFGVVAVTQALLPLLRVARGRVVNMGSISGKAAPPYLGAYSSSKFALESITDVWRMELGRWGMQVSIVEPDSVATPIWGKLLDSAALLGARLPDEVRQLYQRDLASLSRASQGMGDAGMSVQHVVRAVRHALTARRARTRYPVGLRTHLAFWAARHLPDRTRDFFMRQAMGMQ